MHKIVSILLLWTLITIISCHANIPKRMESHINKDIKPCQDFYEYACGNWIKSHPLKDSDVKLESSFMTIDKKNELVFKSIINKKHPLVGELWDSCLAYSQNTTFPFRNDIKRIARATTIVEILELAGQFFRTGVQAFTTLTVEPDSSDAKTNAIYLSPASLPGMDSFYDQFDNISDDYRTYIKALLGASNVDIKNLKRGLTGADTVVDIELELAMIKNRKKGPTLRISIAHAIEKWPNMVGEFLKGVGLFKTTSVTKDVMIYVEKSEYFDAMENFIKSSSVKELRVYMIFVMIHSRVHWLGEKYYKIWFNLFGYKLHTHQVALDRNSFCLSSLIQYMPDLFGMYYTEKAFDEKRQEYTFTMTKYIKEAMGEHISQSVWMEENDKSEAQAKLDNMLFLVGESSIPQSYPSSLSPVNFPFNIRSIVSHSFDATIKKVGQPVNRKEWIESPAIANAFYSLRENRLVLPTAILQPPLFNGEKVHPARNFGAIGTIIGHEMTHAFDMMGNRFDRYGNVREWWSKSTAKGFKALAKELRLHYALFNLYEEHSYDKNVDGYSAQVENIADNGGLALAWDAYRKYMAEVKSETIVKGEVGDQMFFLAFAQTWCANTRVESIGKSDDRTPGKWRVNGAVMNSPEFTKTFQCSPDTPMYSTEEIKIW